MEPRAPYAVFVPYRGPIFYAWSTRAREMKAECDNGKISLEEFKNWLGRA